MNKKCFSLFIIIIKNICNWSVLYWQRLNSGWPRISMVKSHKRVLIICIRKLIFIWKSRNQIIKFLNSNIHAPIFLIFLLILNSYLFNLQIQNSIIMVFLNKDVRKLRICFILFIFQLCDSLFQSINLFLCFQNIVLCPDRIAFFFIVFYNILQFQQTFIGLHKLIMIVISLFLNSINLLL